MEPQMNETLSETNDSEPQLAMPPEAKPGTSVKLAQRLKGPRAQAVVQLRLGSRAKSASEWRREFLESKLLTEAQLQGIAIVAAEQVTSLIAMTPQAHVDLTHLAPMLIAHAATHLDRPLWGSEAKVMDLSATQGAPHRCEIARVVGAKRGAWWEPMSQGELSPVAQAQLCAVIERGIARQALDWGLHLPHPPVLTIVEAGRPMPIKSISMAASGGKPPFVMARVGLVVEVNLKLRGEWIVGPLRGLGFGRLVASRWFE